MKDSTNLPKWVTDNITLVAVGLVVIGMLLGGAIYAASTSSQVNTTQTGVTAVDQPEAKQAKPYTTFSDGMYEVGKDIKPGVYRTDGSSRCYYARLSSFDTNNILENANPDGPVIVEVLPTDKVFESSDCGTWVLSE